MVSTIHIRNIGPIKEVKLELKSINIFMGPQSSGKSTVAKIISQALWAEKNFLTMGERSNFYDDLGTFHNFDKSYFQSKDLEIIYESQWCTIKIQREEGKRDPQTHYSRKKGNELFHNAKIEYIPAERSFVASILNIQKYSQTYNNVAAFLLEWSQARQQYQRTGKFEVSLPDLKFAYRYKENGAKDLININGIDIELQSSSSGQQSLLPLMLVAEEALCNIYKVQRIFSPAEISHIKKNAPGLTNVIELLGELGRKSRTKSIEAELQKLWKQLGYRPDYGKTHLIIEEPELNLYPSTQRGLLQQLIGLLSLDCTHKHTLTITTHSPFILYTLNNSMLAGELEVNAIPKEVREKVSPISPKDVGIWLMKDGENLSLQKEKNHLLSSDFFNDEFMRSHEITFQLLKLRKQTHAKDTEDSQEKE